MAVSAALPGAIGPLAIKTEQFRWKKRASWAAPTDIERAAVLPYKQLHIYDGGVYDNLALQPEALSATARTLAVSCEPVARCVPVYADGKLCDESKELGPLSWVCPQRSRGPLGPHLHGMS